MINTIKEQLEKEGFVIKDFKGTSMYPLFVEGEDLVHIEKYNNDAKLYDIVLFVRDNDKNKYVLHRIIDVKNKYYIVCGDNQNQKEIVLNSQILGKVVGYYKKGEYISLEDESYKNYLETLQLDLTKRRIVRQLNKNEKDFLYLIRSSIFSSRINQKDFDFNSIYEIADNQHLTAFIYKAIDKNICPEQTYKMFEIDYLKNINRNVLFNTEKKAIINKLKENKIEFLLLKGDDIDSLYPTPGTRFYVDVDILLKENGPIRKIISDMGYTINSDNNLIIECTKPDIYSFEFHQKLFIKKDKIEKYFNDIFSRSIKVSDYEYKMNNEDFIVFNLAHFYKHFTYGTGLRLYIDFYFIINKIQHDTNKLESILKEIGLYEFYLYILKTIETLFISENKNVVVDEYIFTNSVYGDLKTGSILDIEENGRFKFLIKKMFPPKEIAYQYMPIVYDYPILLPVAWTYRLFKKITNKKEREKIKAEASCFFNPNQ